jgi:hypothetical protein
VVDFKILVETLIKGTPLAVLIAAIGVLWQLVYTYNRDKVHERKSKRESDLEARKFEYQKAIEVQRFEYEKRRWREQLSLQLTLKHVDARLEEYAKAWSYVEGVAKHRLKDGGLTPEDTMRVATDIKNWRYSKGGLLAQETTRDAAYAFQRALWGYDGSNDAYWRIRFARKLFRDALRADAGIGENMAGETIFDAAEKMQKIKADLHELEQKLGILAERENG